MLFVKAAYAAIINPVVPATTQGVVDPIYAFNNALRVIISIFMLVGVIYFMWFLFMSGYHWIDSQGDPKKYELAKNEFVYGVIGIAVIFSVFAILKFVGIIFGIEGLDILQLNIPVLQ